MDTRRAGRSRRACFAQMPQQRRQNREFGGTGPNGPHGRSTSIFWSALRVQPSGAGIATCGRSGNDRAESSPAILDPASADLMPYWRQVSRPKQHHFHASFSKHSLHITQDLLLGVPTRLMHEANSSMFPRERHGKFDLKVGPRCHRQVLAVISAPRFPTIAQQYVHSHLSQLQPPNADGTVTPAVNRKPATGKH